MKVLLFDIEADGFLEEVSKVHCLVIKELGTNVITVCKDSGETSISQGLALLKGADRIVAHNGIKYDIPVIEKLYQVNFRESQVFDTLVLSRLIFSDLIESDTERLQKGIIEGKHFKSHSLEAWGRRLGNFKDDYKGGFAEWSQEMEDYCVQDVEVLETLYTHLTSFNYSPLAVELEHQAAWICAKQERHGFLFDIDKAAELHATLVGHKTRLEAELQKVFTPLKRKDGKPVIYKKDNPEKGIQKGVPFQKWKMTTFNPGSRDHIAFWLTTLRGWEPKDFTENGKPKVDEDVLNKLPYPEAKLLSEYLMVSKRLGQLAEGDQAWFRQVAKDGRIHGGVITNGAVTGRATHSNPNLAQVPASGSPYGHECRSLFTVPEGKSLVGADLSGLELRCLAHFMARYDGGRYGKVLLEGDIHTENQKAAGLETRNQAKTFISMG